MRIDRRWILAVCLAPRAYAADPCDPHAVAIDPHAVRLDTFHVALSGAAVFRVESSGSLPYVNERFVFYRRPDGHAMTFYGSHETIITLRPGDQYSVGWYDEDTFTAMPQGSCRFTAFAADMNLDNGITVEDQTMFMNWYAAGDLRCDVDDGEGDGVHDAGVGVEDLIYFLEAFGNGGNAP